MIQSTRLRFCFGFLVLISSLAFLSRPSHALTTQDEELMTAVRIGDLRKVSQLIEKGANVNFSGSSGNTPLIQAAILGNHDLVTLLLRKGASPEQANLDGKTALQLAQVLDKKSVVQALLHASASGRSGLDQKNSAPGMRLQTATGELNGVDAASGSRALETGVKEISRVLSESQKQVQSMSSQGACDACPDQSKALETQVRRSPFKVPVGVEPSGGVGKENLAQQKESQLEPRHPKDLVMVQESSVNLEECPQGSQIFDHAGKRYSEKDFVTIGDLHGNFAKFIVFLVKEGIAQLSHENCQRLLDFYHKDPQVIAIPVPEEIKKIISEIQIKNPPQAPNIRLLGDELADRGKNDALTMELLNHLHRSKNHYEIIVSNHGVDFLRMVSGMRSELGLEHVLSKSHEPTAQVVEYAEANGLFAKSATALYLRWIKDKEYRREVTQFVLDNYLNHLKLISVTDYSDSSSASAKKPVVFTHAPTDIPSVFAAAAALGVNRSRFCSNRQLVERNIVYCADKMNQSYLSKLRAAFETVLPDVTILAQTNEQVHPLAGLFWKRHGSVQQGPVENRSWRFANGHDIGNTSDFELDNELGKYSSKGEYQVIRPQDSYSPIRSP
ncbi:MAG: ankyrin repeat domain-containing protein [Bdellovibrionia bacterium]